MENSKVKPKVCITGDMGSGKSFCSEIFKQLGIPVYNSDNESKKIVNRRDVREVINKFFLEEYGIRFYLYGEFRVDVAKDILFNNEKYLKEFTDIIHPYVMEDYLRWHDMQDAPYTIME